MKDVYLLYRIKLVFQDLKEGAFAFFDGIILDESNSIAFLDI